MNLTGSIKVWAGFVPFSNLCRKICVLIFSSFGAVPALLTLWLLSSHTPPSWGAGLTMRTSLPPEGAKAPVLPLKVGQSCGKCHGGLGLISTLADPAHCIQAIHPIRVLHLCLVVRLCPALCDPMDCSPPRLLCPWDLSGERTTSVVLHEIL